MISENELEQACAYISSVFKNQKVLFEEIKQSVQSQFSETTFNHLVQKSLLQVENDRAYLSHRGNVLAGRK